MTLNFDRLSVVGIAADVSSGVTTAVAVAKQSLARVAAYEAVQPEVWITRLPEDAVLAAAGEVDRRISAGERPPLAGAPFAV
jgi:allophanate hydrolase